MLRSVNAIRGYTLEATDGAIGRCDDFLFDDERWTVRYMVADTGRWLHDRKVLIAPHSVKEACWARGRMKVDLTRKEIEESPSLDSDAPVSRQHELLLHAHHGWPAYWVGDGIWGSAAVIPELPESPMREADLDLGDPHLRSVAEVSSYRVGTQDGDVGRLSDFILHEESWRLRFAVVDAGHWYRSRRFLISPGWVESVSWDDRHVRLKMRKEEVQESPVFNPTEPINRDYGEGPFDYYGRPRPRPWTP